MNLPVQAVLHVVSVAVVNTSKILHGFSTLLKNLVQLYAVRIMEIITCTHPQTHDETRHDRYVL